MRGTVLDAFSHQDMPFGLLTTELLAAGCSAPDIHAICQFVGEPIEPSLSGLAVKFGDYEKNHAKARHWRFTLDFRRVRGALHGTAHFDTTLHDPGAVEQLLGSLADFLASVAADPAQAV